MRTLEEQKAVIEEAIERDGPFSHNVISCVLRSVAQEFGVRVANELVEEYELEDVYGIRKVGEGKEDV